MSHTPAGMGGVDDLDVRLHQLAEGQLWLATRNQALAVGLTPRQVQVRLRKGALTRLHEGVYLVGANGPSCEQLAFAACLASDGVASHRTAAALWCLRGFDPGPIEVTVQGRNHRKLAGVICHRSLRPENADMARVGVIPVTRVTRTMLDVGATAPELVPGAVEDALLRGLTTLTSLRRLLDRVGQHGRAGTATLRHALAERDPAAEPTESVLEDAFVALLARHQVEQPVRQHRVKLPDGREVRLDFADPEIKLDIEIDGRRWHSTPTDVERDRRRDRMLVAHGWTVLRYSPDDVKRRGVEVIDAVSRVRLALRSRVG